MNNTYVPNGKTTLFNINGFTAELCTTEESLRIAYKLRYEAYRPVEFIPELPLASFSDHFDLQPHTRTHLIWYEGKPVASVRSAVWSDKYDWLPIESLNKFWSDVHRHIGLNHRILESSRYVVAPEFQGRKSIFAQILMFRLHALCTEIEGCSHIVTAVQPRHIPFYERMLNFRQISDISKIPGISTEVALLATSREESLKTALNRGMPPYEATEAEKYRELSKQMVKV